MFDPLCPWDVLPVGFAAARPLHAGLADDLPGRELVSLQAAALRESLPRTAVADGPPHARQRRPNRP